MSKIEFEDDIAEQARTWLIRMRSGKATQADVRAYRRWCAAHPEHAQKAESLSDIWSALPAAVAVYEERNGAIDFSMPEESRHVSRPARRAFVGFAVAAGASWLALRPPLQLWPAVSDFAADYRTGTGEQRRIALSERVVVEMNTQTRINVLAAQAGQPVSHGIDLLAGEAEVVAAVPVASQTSAIHPVVVVAGRGRLEAQVARFDIRRTREQTCVTCVAGSIAFEHPQQQLTLTANEQLIYNDSNLRVVSGVDPHTVIAWRQGRLVFDGVPLVDVIAEINRYRPGKVILRNAALGRRLVKAEFSIATVGNAIEMIHDAYGAHVTELPGNIVLLS
jgi:transmembrane sensor